MNEWIHAKPFSDGTIVSISARNIFKPKTGWYYTDEVYTFLSELEALGPDHEWESLGIGKTQITNSETQITNSEYYAIFRFKSKDDALQFKLTWG